VPESFSPNWFLTGTFAYVLSQSASGTGLLGRSIRVNEESMTISVNKMGVVCTTGSCSSVAPSASKATLENVSEFPIGIVAGILAAMVGVTLLLVVAIIVIIAVIIKKRKKAKVTVYTVSEENIDENIYDTEAENIRANITYDAFTTNDIDY
jgi:hypothetical protein